jgi:hypothetical protein
MQKISMKKKGLTEKENRVLRFRFFKIACKTRTDFSELKTA